MSKSFLPKDHPKVRDKTGILLINLGTPDHYNFFAVRRYLKEFLSDQRVIEVNKILWWFILNLIILNVRPKNTGANYKKIWFKETDESPLKYYTRMQAEKLAEKYKKENIIVDYAMRYGNPSIKTRITKLLDQGCKKILFFPLYPQYAAATTATVYDEIFAVLQKLRWQPDFRIIQQYSDDKQYIKALVSSLKIHLKKIDFTADAILSSYHGVPKEYFQKGDPYHCYCHKTNRLFNEELKKQKVKLENHLSFQSRFGPKEWLKPYTEDVLKELVNKGVKNLVVITPGFASDCIETLEEVEMEYREKFLELGGENYSMVPCLNDSKESIELIYDITKRNLW